MFMSVKSDLLEQFTQAVFDKLKSEGKTPSSVVIEDPQEGVSVMVVGLLKAVIPVIAGTEKMEHLNATRVFPYGSVGVFGEVEL